MAGKKRCFVSVRALKRLNESLLCEVLNKFPGYLQATRLKLPDPPDRDAMNYEAIQEACLSSDIPADLDDVLFFVSILGTKRGQAQIEKEARYRRRRLDFPMDGLSCPDFAMKAWLHDWPRNRDLLEAAYARNRIFTKCSYHHIPMIRDVRSLLQEPTPERLDEARARLEDYFANHERLGRGTNVLFYDLSPELCFLVRYPGQIERHQAIDEDGNPCSYVFRPEEYDALMYHKLYGDLRLNTNRQRDHAATGSRSATFCLVRQMYSTPRRIVRLDRLPAGVGAFSSAGTSTAWPRSCRWRSASPSWPAGFQASPDHDEDEHHSCTTAGSRAACFPPTPTRFSTRSSGTA